MSGPAHRVVSSIRPSTNSAPAAGTPASPHTPLRTISSNYGSPSSLRADEDCVVIEFGSRYVRAGFAGDAQPKAWASFGPDEQRRAGDYRQWQVNHSSEWRSRASGKDYGDAYELWPLDLRSVDLALVGDKIERAIREVFIKHLLIDSRPRRMALVLPSALSQPILSTILDTLFGHFQPPTISLMSAPILTAIGAGVRATTVVDIGWTETIVTSVYEYREISSRRSVRGSKYLGREMMKLLVEALESRSQNTDDKGPMQGKTAEHDLISFEECEEILTRLAWCRQIQNSKDQRNQQGLEPVREEEEIESGVEHLEVDGSEDATILSIPLSSTKRPTTLKLPFSRLAEPCEVTFFASGTEVHKLDDEELSIPHLIYRNLMYLPVDVRSACMSRVIFTGGACNILGLKKRIMDEIEILIETRGWNPVSGQAAEEYQKKTKLRASRSKQASTGPAEVSQQKTLKFGNAASEEQEHDPIAAQILRNASKGAVPYVKGTLRAIDSIGAWGSASLLTQLKIPTISMVDRDQWLHHGAAGASKPADVVVTRSRQSMGLGGLRAGEPSAWTLDYG